MAFWAHHSLFHNRNENEEATEYEEKEEKTLKKSMYIPKIQSKNRKNAEKTDVKLHL